MRMVLQVSMRVKLEITLIIWQLGIHRIVHQRSTPGLGINSWFSKLLEVWAGLSSLRYS